MDRIEEPSGNSELKHTFFSSSGGSSKYYPGLDEFDQLKNAGANLIPVYRELPADLLTPVSAYLKLMDEMAPSFLLEAVAGGELIGRYSFIGVNPRKILFTKGEEVVVDSVEGSLTNKLADGQSVLDILRTETNAFQSARLLGAPRFTGGAVGYLGYDALHLDESIPRIAQDKIDVPDALFLIADTLAVFDHVKHRLIILTNAHVSNGVEDAYEEAIKRIEDIVELLLRPLPANPGHTPYHQSKTQPYFSRTKEQYEEMVVEAKEQIVEGNLVQISLTNRQVRQTEVHPFSIYRAMRMENPSPYMFYINSGRSDLQIIGASREMHARLENRTAYIRPVSGTVRKSMGSRSRLESAKDKALKEALLEDELKRAEHTGLVDTGRNDIGRVSEYGTVETTTLMGVERYSHAMNMVSQIQGTLRSDLDAYDLMQATFPSGVVTGIPKVKAMEVIESLEKEKRGVYGGAVGFFSYGGNMDSCVAVDTMVIKKGVAYIQAGSRITCSSDPSEAYQECIDRILSISAAIDEAEKR